MNVDLPWIPGLSTGIMPRPRPFPSPLDIKPFVRKMFAVFFIHICGVIAVMFLIRLKVLTLLRPHPIPRNKCFMPLRGEADWQYYVCCSSSVTVLFLLFVGLYLTREHRRSFPMDVFCLSLFTGVFGVFLGMLDSTMIQLILETMLFIAAYVIFMTFQKKADMTSCLLYVMMLCIVMISSCVQCVCASLVIQGYCENVCFYLYYPELYQLFGSGVLAYIVGHYIIFNTQDMVINMHHLNIKPEEYVFACLTLYTDVFDSLMNLAMFWKKNEPSHVSS